jgi:hypothetical protein
MNENEVSLVFSPFDRASECLTWFILRADQHNYSSDSVQISRYSMVIVDLMD